jgi:hypothetical protein
MNSILEALPPWARRAAGYFAAFQVVLSLLYAIRSHLGDLVATELNMDLEGNFTTWWSSLLLAGVGMAALVLCVSKWSDRRSRWSWGVMSAGFFFLSMDETAQVHEQLGQRLFGGEGRLWPLLYLPGIVAGAWAIWTSLNQLSAGLRLLGRIGVGVLFVGIGAELLSTKGEELRGGLEIVIEENSEYFGSAILILVLAVTATKLWRVERTGPE